MKVCIWFSCMAMNYQPPGNMILFCDGEVLVGLGARQLTAKLIESTLEEIENITGMNSDSVMDVWPLMDDTKLWVYDDQGDDGEGFMAVFIDSDDLK